MEVSRVAAEIAGGEPRFDEQVLLRTRSLYQPLAEALPFARRPVTSDIEYGPDPRHRLDLYPADAEEAPTLLFLPGGGFVGGDKAEAAPFYGNVGRFFASHGYRAIVANYRLAPTHTWPAGSEDVARILDWLGETPQLHLLGQSTGASHLATYLLHPRHAAHRDEKRIRSVALMSGFYRPELAMPPGAKLYFGNDDWPARSLTGGAPHPRLLLSIAELDPPAIASQTLDLASSLSRADGRAPELAWFRGHNHVSTVHSLGIGADVVGQTLLRFFSG